MSEPLYRIRPWKWTEFTREGCTSYYPDCPMGSYSVESEDGCVHWKYCFDEYYDELQAPADSVEAAKELCWQDWLKRISPALEELTHAP